MKKAHWFSLILGLTALIALLAVPAAVNAGRPVGNPFVIRAQAEQERQPAIAYNSQWQEYLVVFWNDRPGNDDIRAERVAKDGRLLGGRWIAAGTGAERRYPDVAYNSQRNEYLIVWAEESGGYSLIQAQSFTADLNPTGSVQTLITGYVGLYASTHPAVAYAYTANKYLVVWELELNPPISPMTVASIVGHMLFGDGTKDGSSFNISVDSGGSPRRQPDVAYNRHANGFLVVWQQSVGVTFDIYARLVNGDGYLPPFSPVEIANEARNCYDPAVAAIPTAPGLYKYLVVWEYDYSAGDQDIRGRLVQENGTPHPSWFYIANKALSETNPAVSGTEYGYQYLVTWRLARGTIDKPILGWAVSHDGSLVDDPIEFLGPATDCPAVAAGPAGDFLVAWQDQPVWATNTNIYGQLWGNRVYLPLTLKNK